MRTISFFIPVLFLLYLLPGCGEDDALAPQGDHEEAEGLALYSGGVRTASIFQGIPTDTLHATVGVTSELYLVRFLDEHQDVFDIEDDGKTFGWEIANPSIVDVLQDDGRDGTFEFRLRGLAPGVTTVQFELYHAGHVDFRTGEWPLRVQ